MDRTNLDNILLQLRVEMLELLVLRFSVFMRASGLSNVKESAARTALQATQTELETFAKGLESAAYSDPRMQVLTPDERALFADEYRELLERWKTKLHQLYPGL